MSDSNLNQKSLFALPKTQSQKVTRGFQITREMDDRLTEVVTSSGVTRSAFLRHVLEVALDEIQSQKSE